MGTCNFGEHLTIDGYGANPEKLDDRDLVIQCLDQIPNLIGMKKIGASQVCHVPERSEKDPGGWTGVVLIAESHICIHTFPARGFVSIDVYSCKNGMNKDFIVNYFKEKFKIEDTEINFIKRGTKYPTQNTA